MTMNHEEAITLPFGSRILRVMRDGAVKWFEDDAPTAGAAIAFYTIFSLAPLMVILLGFAGGVFGEQAAHGAVYGQVAGLLGDQGARSVQEIIEAANRSRNGTFAAIVNPIVFFFGATAVFVQLQSTLNAIWGVKAQPFSVFGYVLTRVLSFAVVLAAGFLLTVSLMLNAGIVAFGAYVFGEREAGELLWVAQLLLSILVLSGVFALIFKLLPDRHIDWRDVGIGAVSTAILFTLGKFVIGFYLARTDMASGYGAAGTFVLILLWVYYSSLIFIYGAQVTWLWALQRRERGEASDPVAPAAR